MPEDNGANKAKDLASETGKASGRAAGKTGSAVGKIGKSAARGVSDLLKRIFDGKKKWIAILAGGATFAICIILVMTIMFSVLVAVLTVNEGNKQISNIGGGLQPIGTFYPRLEEPVRGKESVNHTGKKVDDYYFNSTNPLEAAGFGMPNCTAYVWSRAYEMLDSVPNLCTGNAEQWYDYNKTYDYYPYGSEPRLGAIAVWSHDNSGHVAVVEKIEGTKITFSNSAWKSTFFFLLEVDSSIQTNYWDNSSWNFLGFIYVFDEMVYGVGTGGASMLAEVARKEVEEGSHYGGQKYWSWYGFDYRVEWCACFVSYCMNKCGILTEKTGEGHKDAQAGLGWYKERGHFLPGSETPSPGMLINFGEDQHHIGIVIDVKNNTVYTAEGNTYDSRTGQRDSTGFHEYPVGSPLIHGYGTFDTSDFLTSTDAYVPKDEAEFVQLFNNYFKQKGYSKAAICGILGNIYAECGMESYWYFAQYVADAGGAAGNSGGICMWYGDNCDRFKRDCPNWNKSAMAQFQYLEGTLDNDGHGSYSTKYYYWCTGCKAAIQRVPNTRAGAQEAAMAFMNNYERPNMGFDQSIRWEKAAQYWNMIN